MLYLVLHKNAMNKSRNTLIAPVYSTRLSHLGKVFLSMQNLVCIISIVQSLERGKVNCCAIHLHEQSGLHSMKVGCGRRHEPSSEERTELDFHKTVHFVHAAT